MVSPVPFGGVLFADGQEPASPNGRRYSVTSAFRRSAVRGLAWDLHTILEQRTRESPVPFGGVLFADPRDGGGV